MSEHDQSPWGRVDETGTVYVREGDGERAVGQYPDASPEEALAYFERKFTALAGEVTLLEQRAKRGAPASDIAKAVKTLLEALPEANAVGDLDSLRIRLDALSGTVSELTEKQSEEAKAAVAAALAEREQLVAQAEALAAKDPATVQWKQVTAEFDSLFARWQQHQADGPRLPKGDSNELWKRFRAARGTIDAHRRAFFAELDSAHKEVRAAKQSLVEKAEALAAKGSAGIPEYRTLLDQWKSAGRAGKKADDALWARFKAAGDALYGAKAEQDAADDLEFQGNLTLKLELLEQAAPILKEQDRAKAKESLLGIQRRWDEIGKVPRDQVKTVEGRLREIESHVRKLDDDHWHKHNPERQERQEGFAGQLQDAIAKLEQELAEAKAEGDAKKIAAADEALQARRAWLGIVKQ